VRLARDAVPRPDCAMVSASCHCGSVRIEIEAPPTEVTECDCSLCSRYGVLWAYFLPDRVRRSPPDPPTEVYMWDGRSIEFHRCPNCGCVSHWAAADRRRDRMGVNARLMPPEVLAGARVRHRDGADTNRYTDRPSVARGRGRPRTNGWLHDGGGTRDTASKEAV